MLNLLVFLTFLCTQFIILHAYFVIVFKIFFANRVNCFFS